MRRLALLGTLLAGTILASGSYYVARNPERTTLDAVVRQAAGGQYVTLSDGVTHYDISGPADGPEVVLVHGLSVPFYIWDPTAAALSAAGYRVLRYDLLGRGFSDRPDLDYDLDLYDRQLGELLDSTGFRGPVHVMGLSFGGLVTATFSGRHPERVRSLTLVAPAAGEFAPLPWYLRMPVLGPLLFQALVVPGMAEGQLSDFVEPSKWPDWVDRYRVQMQYRGFGRALRSTLMAMAANGGRLDSAYAPVGRQAFPVELIWGVEDRTVPIERSAQIRQAIPRILYHPVERAGHLPHMERAEVVNPILLDFLRSMDSPR
jgi:pimeloyl-ACP methyl ester carboxylesterase